MDITLPSYSVNLVCEGIGNFSSVASSVLEDYLTDLFIDYQDTVVDAHENCEALPHFDDQVRSRLMADDGTVRFTGNEHFYWATMRDPETMVTTILNEINTALDAIIEKNHDVLMHVSASYIVRAVTVKRQFPNMWVLDVEGAPL